MSKANDDINRQKREDLMAVYRQVYPKCWRQRDAYRRTVKHAAPRFYITPKQAYQNILPMLDGDFSKVEKMEPLRKKMYMDLFEIVLETAERREFIGKSLWFIIPWVVTQPAPEFYLAEETFKKIFHEVKGWRRRPRRFNKETKKWESLSTLPEGEHNHKRWGLRHSRNIQVKKGGEE